MAELVDALDSKSCFRKGVQVRFLFRAPKKIERKHFRSIFFPAPAPRTRSFPPRSSHLLHPPSQKSQKMFPYENLEVYKIAYACNQAIYRLLKTNTTIPGYAKNQLGRASLSIMLNIAEGSANSATRTGETFTSSPVAPHSSVHH